MGYMWAVRNGDAFDVYNDVGGCVVRDVDWFWALYRMTNWRWWW
jgi:hypothetical protein